MSKNAFKDSYQLRAEREAREAEAEARRREADHELLAEAERIHADVEARRLARKRFERTLVEYERDLIEAVGQNRVDALTALMLQKMLALVSELKGLIPE